MPRLVLASAAAAVPMGAQGYEEQVAARAEGALREVGPGWQVHRLVFRSMRSDLPGTGRLPMGWLSGAGRGTRAMAGRVVYPRGAVVHRTALELPPAPSTSSPSTTSWPGGSPTSHRRCAPQRLNCAARRRSSACRSSPLGRLTSCSGSPTRGSSPTASTPRSSPPAPWTWAPGLRWVCRRGSCCMRGRRQPQEPRRARGGLAGGPRGASGRVARPLRPAPPAS